MLFAYIGILILLFFVPCCVPARKGIHEDYLAPENTLPIKGLFVFVVLLSHFRGYGRLPDVFLNQSFVFITKCLGALMVAIFFFYSGFGLYASVEKDRTAYLRRFPTSRILFTWLRFAVCVLFYLLFNLLTHRYYTVSYILLAFTGWESIGNSNWFMCVTFILYFCFWLSFSVSKKPRVSLVMFTAITLLLFVLFLFTRSGSWCASIFCMPAGMWYGCLKRRIDGFLRDARHYWITVGAALVLFAGFFLLSRYPGLVIPDAFRFLFYNLSTITFCLLIVACTMKLRFRSCVCRFLGRHVFSIYMLQRLSFAALRPWIANPYLYFLCSAAVTVAAAVLFDLLSTPLKKALART